MDYVEAAYLVVAGIGLLALSALVVIATVVDRAERRK